ncbi:MAG: M13 family metallopeptidase [Rikenellaceae bacterium]|nr:M13 family metallopeptidase [Rikenellaceae bacterium]
MKKIILPAAALLLLTAGCGGSKQKKLSSGIRLENLDTSVDPGTDFYRFATGGWMDANPLTDEFARFGSFDQLRDLTTTRMNGLITDVAALDADHGTLEQKIGTLYNIAMDSAKLNADGVEPIREELDAIAALENKEELIELAGWMRQYGFSPYFRLGIGADRMSSRDNILNISQGGITLGTRDYYVSDSPENREIREKYREHIRRMFLLAGFTETDAARAARAVMEIETTIARESFDRVKLRIPRENYHKMTYGELKSTVPGFDWDTYLDAVGLDRPQELNLSQIEPVRAAAGTIARLPLADHIAYLQWNVINRAAPYLSDELVEQDFDFFSRTMSGTKEMQPRWKRAVTTVNGALGEAAGQLYVEKYFPAEAKERMIHLVDNLKAALAERIDGLDWMSDQTKEQARAKLGTFMVKIGYPDKWKDYSTLDILDDSYWANIKRAANFNYREMLDKQGKPVDNTIWGMTPQTVNAYYSSTTNEICFPAGILQYPFFDMDADDAFNYGGIGVVIGHEMTHGFDDSGRQYDKDGNMNDWWTEEDARMFDARADRLVDFFDDIEVLPGLNANGRFTLGENIADQGGLVVSYGAYKKATADNPLEDKDGFTPDQRFFLAYAGLWAGNVREAEIRRLTTTDPHSLGRWRVNGTLPHIDMWYDAFGITEDDPMYIAPQERAVVW